MFRTVYLTKFEGKKYKKIFNCDLS